MPFELEAQQAKLTGEQVEALDAMYSAHFRSTV